MQQIQKLMEGDRDRINHAYKASIALAQNISSLPKRKQVAAIKALPKNVYVNVPLYWQMQNDPDRLINAIYFFGEPLNSVELDALERNYLHCGEMQLQFAALLYRYNRPFGDIALHNLLNTQSGYPALVILTMNYDNSVMASIIKLFNSNNLNSDIIVALRDSKNEMIARRMLSLYQHHPENGVLAMTLANQNVADALPLMQTSLSGMSNNSPQKVYIQCAISRLELNTAKSDADACFTQLSVAPHAGDDRRINLISGAAYTHNSRAGIGLLALIKNYVSLPSKMPLPSSGDAWIDYLRQEQLAVEAAKALPALDVTPSGSRELLEKLFSRLMQQEFLGLEKDAVAQALIKLDGNLSLVQQVFGDVWLKNRLAVKSLHLRPTVGIPLIDDPANYIDLPPPMTN